KAAECAARAQEAADKDTRALFLRFRDSWLSTDTNPCPPLLPTRRRSGGRRRSRPSPARTTGVGARTTRGGAARGRPLQHGRSAPLRRGFNVPACPLDDF